MHAQASLDAAFFDSIADAIIEHAALFDVLFTFTKTLREDLNSLASVYVMTVSNRRNAYVMACIMV